MPEEEAKPALNPPSLDFGQFIAFILPGFVAFYSLTFIAVQAQTILDSALTKDSAAGAGLVILLSSLALGVIISGVRGFALDNIQELLGVHKPKFDYGKLRNPNTLAAFREAINNTYRYAQSYGNMALALVLALVSKFWIQRATVSDQLPFLILVSLTAVALFLCHRSMLDSTYKALAKILA